MKIKKYKSLFKEKKIELPEIGDEILVGKWKNKTAIVKGYGIDDKGQPTPALRFRLRQ